MCGVDSVPGEGWEEELRWQQCLSPLSCWDSCPLAALSEWGGMGSAPRKTGKSQSEQCCWAARPLGEDGGCGDVCAERFPSLGLALLSQQLHHLPIRAGWSWGVLQVPLSLGAGERDLTALSSCSFCSSGNVSSREPCQDH